MLHTPNYHNLEHSSCVSQRDFLSLTKFHCIQGEHRVLKSCSVALPCVVLFGQGGTQITDCSWWHRASAEADGGCHSSHSAAVMLHLIQRSLQEQMSCARAMPSKCFEALFLSVWRCWPPFQKIMVELPSFKCNKWLLPSLPHQDLVKGCLICWKH